MAEDFKKNEKYSQEEITGLVSAYCSALDAKNDTAAEAASSRIYHYIEKYVYKVLWDNYGTLMRSSHQEDLKQEVWARIFKELRNYNPAKGAITTFLTPWIRHVVADYASKNFRNTSAYYAGTIQKVNGAQNYCKSIGLNANDMEILVRLTGLSETTVKHTLAQMAKTDSVSYEALADAGADYVSREKGPEERVLESESENELLRLCRATVTPKEMTYLEILTNPDSRNRQHESYRAMMQKFPGTNIPQLKKEISRLFAKLRANKDIVRRYPWFAIQEKIIEENYVPVLDGDDTDETDEMFDSFLHDLDENEENSPQVRKI